MTLMKWTMIFLTAMTLLGSETTETRVEEGFERGIERYQRDACDIARKNAKAKYAIVEMDAGCRCERGDDHNWHCDIGFTYRPAGEK